MDDGNDDEKDDGLLVQNMLQSVVVIILNNIKIVTPRGIVLTFIENVVICLKHIVRKSFNRRMEKEMTNASNFKL